MKINTKKSLGTSPGLVKPKSNMTVIGVALIAMILLATIIFFGLQSILRTETYWTLKADVPAKALITPSMLEENTVSLGGAPKNALTLGQIERGQVFTKIPLKKGDIISQSSTGITLDTSTGIPDKWIVTSFVISAQDAAAGNISRGDYFDIIGVNQEGGSKYIAKNVLALDTIGDESSTRIREDGSISNTGTGTIQYVVGMPPDFAATFHHALSQFPTVKMVKSPFEINYKAENEPASYNLDGVFKFDYDTKVMDLKKGTDNSFRPIVRDSNNRPVTTSNCAAGLISPAELCQDANNVSNIEAPEGNTQAPVSDNEAKNVLKKTETKTETKKETIQETNVETTTETTTEANTNQ